MRKLFILIVVVAVAFGGWAGYRHFAATVAPTEPGPNYLVSLGDSVAAGDGLPLVDQPSQADAACFRSSQAAAMTIAAQLNLQLKQFACSGAKTTTGLLQPQPVGNTSVPAQLAAARPFIRGNDVVLTIGANDVGWSQLLTNCVQGTCADQAAALSFLKSEDILRSNLDRVLTDLQKMHPAQVVVNQYYRLADPTDTCFTQYNITASKILWVDEHAAELNNLIGQVAQAHGTKTEHIDFSGHELCDTQPWVQRLFSAAPMHPTAEGQAQIARQDLQALQK